MRVLADGVALGHRGDHGHPEVLRVRAREANALDALDGVHRAQQLAELGANVGPEISPPRVDVLAQQRDLANAVVCEPRDLGEDLARPPADLAAAHGGHDAVGAHRVAAHRDLHPRLGLALALGGELRGEAALVRGAERRTRDA